MHTSRKQFLFVLLILYCLLWSCKTVQHSVLAKGKNNIEGESFVLANTVSSNFLFASIIKGSVSVRSTYLRSDSGSINYTEGIDFAIDYKKGTIARTLNSRIPNYSNHPLFGKTNFSRFALNPSNLLRTATLGVVAPDGGAAVLVVLLLLPLTEVVHAHLLLDFIITSGLVMLLGLWGHWHTCLLVGIWVIRGRIVGELLRLEEPFLSLLLTWVHELWADLVDVERDDLLLALLLRLCAWSLGPGVVEATAAADDVIDVLVLLCFLRRTWLGIHARTSTKMGVVIGVRTVPAGFFMGPSGLREVGDGVLGGAFFS